MNILDVIEPIEVQGNDEIESIFIRQRELHKKYIDIEVASGIGLALIHNRPWSIDDRRCQYVIKDYCWRVTEELAEALTAHSDIHRIEEMIDALHFYTELIIISCDRDFTMSDLRLVISPPSIVNVIMHLGTAANTLKQKPWKQHHFPTEYTTFRDELFNGYCQLLHLIGDMGNLSLRDIHDVYYKKSEVNRFRIRSGY